MRDKRNKIFAIFASIALMVGVTACSSSDAKQQPKYQVATYDVAKEPAHIDVAYLVKTKIVNQCLSLTDQNTEEELRALIPANPTLKTAEITWDNKKSLPTEGSASIGLLKVSKNDALNLYGAVIPSECDASNYWMVFI